MCLKKICGVCFFWFEYLFREKCAMSIIIAIYFSSTFQLYFQWGFFPTVSFFLSMTSRSFVCFQHDENTFFCIYLMVTRYFCVLKPIFDSIVNNNKNLAEWFVDLVMWKANIAKKRARDEISGKQKWYSNRIASEKKSVKMAEAGLRERTRVVTRNKNNIWY